MIFAKWKKINMQIICFGCLETKSVNLNFFKLKKININFRGKFLELKCIVFFLSKFKFYSWHHVFNNSHCEKTSDTGGPICQCC